jgi:hypothetical protein
MQAADLEGPCVAGCQKMPRHASPRYVVCVECGRPIRPTHPPLHIPPSHASMGSPTHSSHNDGSFHPPRARCAVAAEVPLTGVQHLFSTLSEDGIGRLVISGWVCDQIGALSVIHTPGEQVPTRTVSCRSWHSPMCTPQVLVLRKRLSRKLIMQFFAACCLFCSTALPCPYTTHSVCCFVMDWMV